MGARAGIADNSVKRPRTEATPKRMRIAETTPIGPHRPTLAGRPAFARVERIASIPLTRRNPAQGQDPAANATRSVPPDPAYRGRLIDLFV